MIEVQPERGPDVQLLGDAVLIRGAAAVDAYRVLAKSAGTARRDGIAPPRRLLQLLTALRAAAEAAEAAAEAVRGTAELRRSADPARSPCDDIGTQEAAAMIGCSTRYVRQLLATDRLRARVVRGSWRVPVSEVVAYIDARRST